MDAGDVCRHCIRADVMLLPFASLSTHQRFQAQVDVYHKQDADALPYTAVVHKVPSEQGSWAVSAQVTMPSKLNPEFATVVTAINGSVYVPLFIFLAPPPPPPPHTHT